VAEPAVPELARIVCAPPRERRFAEWVQATHALGHMGPAAVAPLLRALSDAPDHLRAHLLPALIDVGPGAAEAIPQIVALFVRKPDANWSGLAGFLCAVGEDKALPHLYPLLVVPDPVVGSKAAEVLGQMAETSAVVREAMIAASTTQPPAMRLELVKRLGRLERLYTAVARAMLRAVDDPDAAVRAEGAHWLRQRLSPTNLDRLLASEPPDVQSRARQHLLDAGQSLSSPVR
jgi:HEAT repeat protein